MVNVLDYFPLIVPKKQRELGITVERDTLGVCILCGEEIEDDRTVGRVGAAYDHFRRKHSSSDNRVPYIPNVIVNGRYFISRDVLTRQAFNA